jgi:hypothetical protein
VGVALVVVTFIWLPVPGRVPHPTGDSEPTPEPEPVPLAPTGPAAQLSGEAAGVRAEVQ